MACVLMRIKVSKYRKVRFSLLFSTIYPHFPIPTVTVCMQVSPIRYQINKLQSVFNDATRLRAYLNIPISQSILKIPTSSNVLK